MNESGNAGAAAVSALHARSTLDERIDAPHFRYAFECRGADGELKWVEDFENTVVTGGADDLLDKYFAGSAYTAAWYLGLKGTGTAAATDTLASHGTWVEVNPYTGNRPALAFASASARSKVATAISYSITVAGPTTVAGAFTASVNTGTAGILYSAGDFATSRSVVSGDTLTVTLTVSV